MIKLSNTIKKRFCKDFALPIGIFDNEYFEYFMQEYDSLLNTSIKKYMLYDALLTLGGEEGFMQEFNRIKEAIINDISSKEVYKDIQCGHKELPQIQSKYKHPGQNIYSRQFDGREFISIDIRKANFYAMSAIDSSLVNGATTWSEFLSKYTSLKYYHESKQLRQVIFGNLMPKKQQQIQKGICNMIADSIKDMDNTLEIAIVSTDEILILNHPNPKEGVSQIKELIDNTYGITSESLRVEAFRLESVHPEKPFFIKRDLHSDEIVFKNIPQVYFAQVFKHYFGVGITEYDKSFFYEGQIAVFKESIYAD